ncbi:MAG TPA: class I SAM-dependent methyltransferase [Anaerolineales bacterium]
MEDKIEILSVELLDQHRPTVRALKRLAGSLGLEFGWHYLLDLTWIISLLGAVKGKRILDAGAGTGVLQWYLAEQGAEVISVDRLSRANLPLRFRRRYNVRGLRSQDLLPSATILRQSFTERTKLQLKVKSQVRDLAGLTDLRRVPGRVIIYNQELQNLSDLADASIDAVVAVSALEHNPPEGLPGVVIELQRVLKPDGVLLATLGAARQADWLHVPSQGWCYTDASLRRHFDLPADTLTNYDRHDDLFSALRDCAELRDGLASFYYQSGDNGMPWGRWDPQYQPVGVCKVKRG